LTPQQIERVNLMAKRKKQYFIHETDNPENGIWVDKDFVKQNCKSIKAMVEDLGEEISGIPLPCPIDVIKLGFGILQNKEDVKNFSFEELFWQKSKQR
jgi:hypothetical protein